jgi:regulatory protein
MNRQTDKSCLSAALRLLGRRDHSCFELSQKLKQRGFSGDMISPVIATCIEMKYLDDGRFCEGYADRLRRNGYGVLRIVQKLKAARIDAVYIQKTIDRQCPEESQIEDCRKAFQKKWVSQTEPGHPEILCERDRSRLYRFLQHRGFASEVILKVMDEAEGFDLDGI